MIRVTFIDHGGVAREAAGAAGQSLMALAVANAIPGIDGDCGGALACCTCHVMVLPEWRERTGTASDFESCMLEVALDPTPNSRLGCQIRLTPELDGLIVRTPERQKA